MTRPSISSEKLREYMRRYRDGEPIDLLTAESGVHDLKRRIRKTYGDVAPKPPPPPPPVQRKGRRLDSWSAAEDAILRKAYILKGMARRRFLRDNLTTRSMCAAHTRATILRLTRMPDRWGPEDDDRLVHLLTVTEVSKRKAAIAQSFPGRTFHACITRYRLITARKGQEAKS